MPFHPETVTLHIAGDNGDAWKIEAKRLTYGDMLDAANEDIANSQLSIQLSAFVKLITAIRCNDELADARDLPSYVIGKAVEAHPDFGGNSDVNENSSENSASITDTEPSTLI